MALSFIGKHISLISHSDVRYRGILAGIDPAASTIQLSNVFSMGTESRRPPNEFIPPVAEPYSYIIFRASEVKDLAVDENTPRRSVHDDPAVLGASAPAGPTAQFSYPAQAPPPQPGPVPPQQGYPPHAQPPAPAPAPPAQAPTQPQPQPRPAQAQQAPAQQQPQKRSNSVHTAAASLETVERALGDLRVSNANASNNTSPNTTHHPNAGRGGRRGRGGRAEAADQLKVPNTDFDFQSMNAKFDKAALGASKPAEATPESEGDKEEKEVAYNPQKSFFDSLSSSASSAPPAAGSGVGARRGRGGGRNRREEERERNVATFGEPGGVGLMGPGAYVGGWGGYGRRGGRRGRGAPGGGQGRGGVQSVQPARS